MGMPAKRMAGKRIADERTAGEAMAGKAMADKAAPPRPYSSIRCNSSEGMMLSSTVGQARPTV